MKAAVFRGPGKLAVEELPNPKCPDDGIILKVEACGICGSDLRTWKVGMRSDLPQQILGHEIAGVVAQAGPKVSKYKVGDRLAIAADVHCGKCYYCRRALFNLCEEWKLLGTHYPGGMAQFMAMPADIVERGIVHRMPEGLSAPHAALAEPLSSVLSAQQLLQIEPGEVVAVLGDGPIAFLHLQVARVRGAKPVMIGIMDKRLEMAPQLGAWKAINGTRTDAIAQMKELTEGRGPDAAIIACPAREAQADAVKMVRKRGRIALFGGLPKNDPITHLDSNLIHYNELFVIGTFSYHPSQHATALELIAQGRVDAGRIVTATFPLSQITKAFEVAASGEHLKVVVVPD